MVPREEPAALGKRLKVARNRAGVTQEEAAHVAGVTRCTISNWESGRHLPSLLQFRALVGMYGGTGYQILFGSNPFELTRDEAKELSQAAREFSPALRSRVDMLLALLSQAATDNASRNP